MSVTKRVKRISGNPLKRVYILNVRAVLLVISLDSLAKLGVECSAKRGNRDNSSTRLMRDNGVKQLCILLDIKMKKKTTITVKGCGKPELQLFDTYKTGTEIKNDSYFYWKAKDNSDKRYRFIIFREENNLKGKTMKHSYNVICYKYSKVVTNIEKI